MHECMFNNLSLTKTNKNTECKMNCRLSKI